MAARNALLLGLLSLLVLLTAVDADCNNAQPLYDPDPNDDVVTLTYGSFVTQINLQEGWPKETETDIPIAVFDCPASDVPKIQKFVEGTQANLGLDTNNVGGKWYLIVKNTQDYENPNHRTYRFLVESGTDVLDVLLYVTNLDDESPYFNLPDTPSCEIKETLIGETECYLPVYDADAIMGDMKYRVLESEKDSENISLIPTAKKELCKPATPKDCVTLALNIIKQIEFIDKPVHSLVLEVKDQAGHTGNMPYIVQVTAENKEIPQITPPQLTVEIDEEYSGIIDIKDTTITVSDRDALDYGQFNIAVEGNGADDCYKAFDVIPRAGYRKTEVRLSVIDPKTLDYDKGTCNDIIVKIKATEIGDESRAGEAEVTIKLRDINDETPEFEKEEFVFPAVEHENPGTVLGDVKATDRDAFDKITYSLTSDAYLTIDPDTGSVKVKADFNYERQPQVFATVKAEDTNTPPHFAYAQIRIDVTDINDEKPQLILPSNPTSIDEVTAIGTEVTVDVTATDEDGDPDLEFSIDWDNSRALKQGLAQKPEVFKDCLKIDTVEDNGNKKSVKAVLKVDKIMHWEDFDTLYVNIVVEDKNTHADYSANRFSSGILTITINDKNDSPPVFSPIGKLTFRENTAEGQLFGIIVTTDQDGPGFNEVNYTLVNELYEKEYVTIHPDSGELRTGKDQVDFEEIEQIEYTVVANDGVNIEKEKITIQIEDLNDETPYFVGDYSKPMSVPENTNEETSLVVISAKDNDTSPEFHTLRYYMDDNTKGPFEINSVSGEVYLPEGRGDKLDYEKTKSYVIEVTVKDRCHVDNYCYPDSSSNAIKITIELEDLDDEPPAIQNGGGILRTIPEDEGKQGADLGYVNAIDLDADGKAEVTFSLTAFVPEEGRELFDISRIGAQTASIKLKRDLDKWGEYTLTVKATDAGKLSDTADFKIIVTDVNNNAPVFEYPNETTVIRLNISGNVPGKVLTDVNGRKLSFSAIDDKDNGRNGTDGMSYSIIGDDTATKYVEMSNNELWLIKEFDPDMDKRFVLRTQACDGDRESNKLCTNIETEVRLRVNIQYEPVFDASEWETNFTENVTGLSEIRRIEVPVTDPNNAEECKDTDDCEKDEIYYFIFDGDKDIFSLDERSGELSLKEQLDREKQSAYTLTVVVTNYQGGPQGTPGDNSRLKITINVIDVIDTAPEFTKELFAAGINIGDKVGDLVTTFTATDNDLGDELTYQIVPNSMTVTDSTLQNLVDTNPFKVTTDSLRLNIDVQDTSLRGMFTFTVQVSDKAHLTDLAACQVYIISEDNLVSMRFQNNQSFVDSKKIEIADIFTNVFKHPSNVKKVARALNSEGVPLDDQTDLTSYFVDENGQTPVNKEEITRALTNKQTYNELREALLGQKLVLDSISDTQSEAVANTEGVLQTVLIVVSVVLGTLVVVLFAAFFIRTRSLNRRLEALSTTKFGSQDSGLNRIGLAVPNTNQHAVEGSNPIWGNEELADRNFDNISQSSGDSDLIGVEENPEFSPYGKSGFPNDGFTPELETGRRATVNPMLASGLNPLSAAALKDAMNENSANSKSMNPMAGKFNSNVYDSDNDSRRSSENGVGQNSNFTFFGRIDSTPITEL